MLSQQCVPEGRVLPWVKLLQHDLHIMYSSQACYDVLLFCNNNTHVPHPTKCDCEGQSCSCRLTWHKLVLHVRWKDAVNALFFMDSQHDKTSSCAAPSSEQYVCQICVAAGSTSKNSFESSKALDSHSRAMHRVRNLIRMYIGDSTGCPSCKVVFSHRVNLLAHLRDKRRPKCRNYVMENCFPIEPSLLL